ncbi:uncharacterized protein G2W53_037400 [Senna tora]|uniref:Reverse transcriptase zinc-binding domain-containing protein n=1 Tax=Senna tora TaxID=362788 RepID=A0A834SVX9_9FABA|nr:uncharacterized protein G2W53_037400 [Senna tora]
MNPNKEVPMKENIDPEVSVVSVTHWKRVARTKKDHVLVNKMMPTLGKRRDAEENRVEDVGGRELLSLGLQKSVGDGKSTLIWKDPWIPGLKVNEQIAPITGAPNMMWLAMKDVWDQQEVAPELFCSIPSGFWKSIWQLPLHSWYKVFLWRACIGIIPTVEALKQRDMLIEEGCIKCGTEVEDVYHALIDCNSLRQVWDEAWHDFKARVYHMSLLEWLSVD